ncbi:conserved hypothetical protein [Planktothrix serta PCC 8927]|uniref:Uncharacterized protein n=1 Tax=Planktothrix serta PCC 8927 TaxID=671068 RepID=A0A7Z9BG23_9CYAN|nr:hypothetical protein [Planktothrix serta]VXD12360.1 conserved hypothetical protein [Planktothrix serta PCC 8927]
MGFEQNYNKQCLEKLIWAMQKLEIDCDETELPKIAELIVQTMTGPWRYFHTPNHIFEVGGEDDPIEVLAALFHDVVYVQVDQSVNFNLTYYIAPFIRQVGEHLLIRDSEDLPPDQSFEMVRQIFDFAPGQTLSPMSGQNEFLSGLVASKVLEPLLPLELLVQIVACIEATIPFRTKTELGSNSDILYQRLKEVYGTFNLKLTDEELIETVKRSVRLSNRDVGSFAHISAAKFLDNTWNLLPETNHYLKNSSSYTINQYRTALQKMEGFMNFIKPEIIFHHFQGYPDDLTYKELVSRARRNIEVGRLYLASKLFTIAFLEALSLRFGRVIPVSTLMGEMPTEGFSAISIADFLPPNPNPHQPQTELEQLVLTLLDEGRTQSSSYDIKNSPLTTYMVKCLGFDEIVHQRNRAQEFFQDKITHEEFLAGCDADVKKAVTNGIVQLFDSRKTALCQSL